MLPDAAVEHHRTQQRLTLATLLASRRAWRGMGEPFDTSWRTIGGRLFVLISAAQLAAARNGIDYVPALLAETDQPDNPAGEVNPKAFAGVASDGRDLRSLLYGAVVESKTAMRTASSPADALAQGGRWLDMVVQTLVADAGRGATGVGLAARPQITGYVRMLQAPSCSRCAVLAGKWFRWNEGFQRHPRCDCRHIPARSEGWAHAEGFVSDPLAAIRDGQVHGLSVADRKAIVEDGADVGQVINARRSMYTADAFGRRIKGTREGTTLRASVGKALSAEGLVRTAGSRYRTVTVPRLRPETIYREATDRDDAIRLLKRFGYLT